MRWHKRFISLAEHVSAWSKDPSTKVGAVIADPQRRIMGIGYNGFPRGINDTEARLEHRPTKYTMVVHAEANAILNSSGSLEGCTIFIWPLMPCAECTKLIIQSGITRVVFADTEKSRERMNDHKAAQAMLLEAGVEVRIQDV